MMMIKLGKRQVEVLLSCVNGDNLLGESYPRQRVQRMALVSKGLIELASVRVGYVPTELGLQVAKGLKARN